MKIIEFDKQKGIYNFELEPFETQFHSHPAKEIIFSEEGGILVETRNAILKNVSFVIISANIEHKVVAAKPGTQILMIECFTNFFSEYFLKKEIKVVDGIYVEQKSKDRNRFLNELSNSFVHLEELTKDERVGKCLKKLNEASGIYSEMMTSLKAEVNLSESRLSHIFKDHIGLSIKKYAVWSRLKIAFQLVLQEEINMSEAALESGFYDQAHLSKAFKQMLGMCPSEVYNSRMIQE